MVYWSFLFENKLIVDTPLNRSVHRLVFHSSRRGITFTVEIYDNTEELEMSTFDDAPIGHMMWADFNVGP